MKPLSKKFMGNNFYKQLHKKHFLGSVFFIPLKQVLN